VDDVTLECGRVCEGNCAAVPSVDVEVVGGRTPEYWLYRDCDWADIFPSVDVEVVGGRTSEFWLYRECDGVSADEPAAESGMLEYWLYKTCDVVGMSPSVDAAEVGGRPEEYWL
jgi:hypothetical protein